MRNLTVCTLAAFAGLVGLPPASAEVVKFEILRREPFAEGKSFGETGPYEKIVGRVHYALDPDLKANAGVVDLKLATRNAAGKVAFHGDLYLLAPKDPSRARALLYDVNNRGNKSALGFFNGAGGNEPKSAGDGFLMRHGFVVVWSGWDGELLPGNDRLRLHCPPVRPTERVVAAVRCEMVPTADTKRTVVNWDNHGSYRPTQTGIAGATLTHRLRPDEPRVTIPRDKWTLHVTDVPDAELPKVELEIPSGLSRGHIYELIYEAQEPLVMGTSFTSVRDLISALRNGTGEGNPLLVEGKAPAGLRAHGFGISQSGRFLREMMHRGHNGDEAGRKVFDGVIPHVAGGGLGSFDHRFAQPTRHAAQHDHDDYPPDRFPFAYEPQTDPFDGRRDGILAKCTDATRPIVLHTQSAAEYWTRSGSLPHTTPDGSRDAEPPANVRFYTFGGCQHGPGGFPPSRGDGQTLSNPGDFRPFVRALLLALDRQAAGGAPCPPSVYPRIASATLVAPEAMGFPDIPGIRKPEVIRRPPALDFGPRWLTQGIIDNQPPKKLGRYTVRVPKCDADGNDLGCLSPPEVAVPVATYTGWTLRSAEAGAEGELVSLRGSYIPFAISSADRKQAGDPRPSLQERYGTLDRYMTLLEAECRRREKEGYLLSEDVERILKTQRSRVAPMFAAIR